MKIYTDNELENLMEEAIEFCSDNKSKHYANDSQEKLFEIYFDDALEMIVQGEEIPEDKQDGFCDRIRKLF